MFSGRSMADHWCSGYDDAMRTLRHPEVLDRTANGDEVSIFDFANDGNLAATFRPVGSGAGAHRTGPGLQLRV